MHQIRSKVPNWLWAGLVTAVFTFLGLFTASLLGWVTDVVEWASTDGVSFPDVTVLGKAAVAAAAAGFVGLLNTVYRFAQSKTSLVPGDGPTYS